MFVKTMQGEVHKSLNETKFALSKVEK